MPPIIECENLIKIHKQGNLEVVALQGLDFAMERGEFISVVGRSGAGKSTLLRILAGLDRPSAGKVQVAGTELSEISQRNLTKHYRRNVGFLWQDFNRNLIPYLNAERNVELPMLLAGVSGRKRRQRTMDLLEAVGLRSRAFADVHTMSGGEQQRLALCVALATEPELLLADEPTGELDTETGLEIYELLRSLAENRGLSVLVVTHDVALAQRTDRVVRLADGRIAMQGRLGAAELLAVDARGMVQLPRGLLLEAGITDRLEAEIVDDGILLRPHEEPGIGPGSGDGA
jgi:ABC-type lipoprotein export system ATPase subunit